MMQVKLGGGGSDDRFLKLVNLIIGSHTPRDSLIDLCCYHARVARQLQFRSRVFVDVNDHSAVVGSEFVKADVVNDNHAVFNGKYDVSTCLDGIEHMPKEDGHVLISRMEAMSTKQILFTPLDPWMLDPTSTDPEAHKCVWSPDELPGWAHIVMPEYHPTLGIGAFFFWKCPNIEDDFQRVRHVIERGV